MALHAHFRVVNASALAASLVVALSACSASHTAAPAPTQPVPRVSVVTSTAERSASATTSPVSMASVASAPAAAVATSAEPSNATPTTSLLDHAPVTIAGGPTVPVASSAEDEAIFAGYRAFEVVINQVASHPRDPDWSALRAVTLPDTFELMKADLEQRFASGQIANVVAGYELRPAILHRYSADSVSMTDCVIDRTYWMSESSGQAMAGEVTTQHLTALSIDMIKVAGSWRVSGTLIGNHPCAGS